MFFRLAQSVQWKRHTYSIDRYVKRVRVREQECERILEILEFTRRIASPLDSSPTPIRPRAHQMEILLFTTDTNYSNELIKWGKFQRIHTARQELTKKWHKHTFAHSILTYFMKICFVYFSFFFFWVDKRIPSNQTNFNV